MPNPALFLTAVLSRNTDPDLYPRRSERFESNRLLSYLPPDSQGSYLYNQLGLGLGLWLELVIYRLSRLLLVHPTHNKHQYPDPNPKL